MAEKKKVAALAVVALGALAYQIALAAQRRAEQAGAAPAAGLPEPEPWAYEAVDYADFVWGSAAPDEPTGGWASFLPAVLPAVIPGYGVAAAVSAGYDALAGEPRGIRNHNPGNIELGDNWLGLRAEQTDGRFAQFESPFYGLRAMGRVLMRYRSRGWNTPRLISSHWAPADDGNNVEAHAGRIAAGAGVGIDSGIHGSAWIGAVEGLILAENGKNPYSSQEIASALSAGGLI